MGNPSDAAAAIQESNFKALKEKLNLQSDPIKNDSTVAKKAVNILQEKVQISSIEMVGVGKDIEKWMRRRCSLKIGDYVCKDDIDKLIFDIEEYVKNHDSWKSV